MKIFLLIILSISIAHAKPVAKIIHLKGDVFVLGEAKKKRLYKGATLKNNQTIKVEKSSVAIIGFGSFFQSKVKVAANSELKITESISRSNGPLPVKNYNLFLKAGNILINFLKTKTKALTVQTKTAALGVRGTTFFTHVSENNNTSMSVKKGEVAVHTSEAEGELLVAKDSGTMTNEQGKLIEPRKLEWEKNVNWNLNHRSGKLMHSKNLHESIAASYEKYKKEQEAKLEAFRDRVNRQREMIKKDIESQKKRMFDYR